MNIIIDIAQSMPSWKEYIEIFIVEQQIKSRDEWKKNPATKV